MPPKPSELIKARGGDSSEAPVPFLLQALWSEEWSGILELKIRQLEKRIQLDEGAPVRCRSNLLHETLGKFLVERGKLPEADYQKALAEQAQTGKAIGEILVTRGLLPPFELYKQLQASTALSILDCFRWTEGTFRLRLDADEDDGTAVRINAAQLILTGINGPLPFESVVSQFSFAPERRFIRIPGKEVAGLKIPARDVRLLQTLRTPMAFLEVTQKLSLETEETMRRLYAFYLLGLVCFEDERPAEAPRLTPSPILAVAAPEPSPAPAPVAEDPGLRDALATAFLEHRGKDPFDLLGVAENASHAALRQAFLARVDRLNPMRFTTADLREKAELLLLAYARAFGSLSDEDQKALWRKRREASRAKAQGPAKLTAAETFQIRTGLLDAEAQFREGQKRLQEQNFRGALQYFEYACDIDPKPHYQAHRAWSRFLLSPAAHGRLALGELASVIKLTPTCEDAHRFVGDILREGGDAVGAEQAYLRAQKLNPKNPRYAELIKSLR